MIGSTSYHALIVRNPGWLSIVTWIATLVPIIYVVSRLLWAFGLPVGIDQDRMDDLDLPGTGSISLILLSIPALATAWFTWRFLLKRYQTLSGWIPVASQIVISRRLVLAALLVPIIILTYSNLVNVLTLVSDLLPANDLEMLPAWSRAAHIALFGAWWLALVVVTVRFWRNPESAI